MKQLGEALLGSEQKSNTDVRKYFFKGARIVHLQNNFCPRALMQTIEQSFANYWSLAIGCGQGKKKRALQKPLSFQHN